MLTLYSSQDYSNGGRNGCKNDGREPSYMSANPSYYLSSSLAKCCSSYFSWNYDTCVGNERGVCVRALWYVSPGNMFASLTRGRTFSRLKSVDLSFSVASLQVMTSPPSCIS